MNGDYGFLIELQEMGTSLHLNNNALFHTTTNEHGQTHLGISLAGLDWHSVNIVALPLKETMQNAVGQRAIGASIVGMVGASPCVEVEVVDQCGDSAHPACKV